MRSLLGASMTLVVGAEDVCTSADCEASAMVQRINRKQTIARGPLTQLLQSTTKMLREGSTPAVIVFVNDTLAEIEINITDNIWLNHQADQKFIDDQLLELQAILKTYNTKKEELTGNRTTEELRASRSHADCRGYTTPCNAGNAGECDEIRGDDITIGWARSDKSSNAAGQEPEGSEAYKCLDASRKNWDRALKWAALLKWEATYTLISQSLHEDRFCPPLSETAPRFGKPRWLSDVVRNSTHPDLTDALPGDRWYAQQPLNPWPQQPFMPGTPWFSNPELFEGDTNPMVAELEDYRKATRGQVGQVGTFGHPTLTMMTFNQRGKEYFQKIELWVTADGIATTSNSSHVLKKGQCEGKKTSLETASCTRAEHHVAFIKDFEEDWAFSEDIFNRTKESIVISEKDRIREIVTLGMVKCLLEKIKSKNGTACASVGEADEEIQDCETSTVNTTRYEIDYECSPDRPVHPIVKVFPGQPTEYSTRWYSVIENHGFCFSEEHTDAVHNKFPMDAIHTSCSFVTWPDTLPQPVFEFPYTLE